MPGSVAMHYAAADVCLRLKSRVGKSGLFTSKNRENLESGPLLICRNPPSRACPSLFPRFPPTRVSAAGIRPAQFQRLSNHRAEGGADETWMARPSEASPFKDGPQPQPAEGVAVQSSRLHRRFRLQNTVGRVEFPASSARITQPHSQSLQPSPPAESR